MRSFTRSARFGFAMGLVAVSMAGCGGGGGNHTTPPPVSATVTIAPSPATVTVGKTQQFTATVSGTGGVNGVTWAVSCSSCSNLSPGTISDTGLYTTPYPSPGSVTVKATSTAVTSASASVAVTLSAPATAAGPVLTVDAGAPTHAISPYIYGMNAFQIAPETARAVNLSIDRWGGNATSRYNYRLDVTSSASDWYFENQNGLPGGSQSNSSFNAQVTFDQAAGAKTMGTVPVNGWVAKDATSCSFPTSTFVGQQKADPYGRGCGNGVYPQGSNGCTNSSGCNITGIDPTATSTAVDARWAGDWVAYLASKFGTAANGGVAVYDLDNEPSWWDAVHRDVHPKPFTYDEVTNNGIAAAKAIKAADPTAEVSGPVVDYWWNYFYSKQDVENGWGSGPCYQPWQNPTDRDAHGGVPLIEYYLQQFKKYDDVNHVRLLDYLDLHTYFAADNLAFSTAGDTAAQEARLDSTRVFWDPSYTDPNFLQPNYHRDPNYTTDCNHIPLQAPQVIPMMKQWVASDYPGTRLAITEYNWGGQEHIGGALAQADILGIFGREGLDIGTLWGTPDPVKQAPGLIAFEIYRNYDGKNSMFGETALLSTSGDQGKLSVYGALRGSDNTVTVVVINKTFGDLTSTLSLNNLAKSTTSAQAFIYSSADLTKILPQQKPVTVTPPAGSGTASTISMTFPAQSITLLVAPN